MPKLVLVGKGKPGIVGAGYTLTLEGGPGAGGYFCGKQDLQDNSCNKFLADYFISIVKNPQNLTGVLF